MKKELSMTDGNLFKKLWIFSIPLIFTGLLQLLYNACDLIVCGQFGSEHSVAAISATSALINLIINLFLGLSVGANVLMARCFGAKLQEKGQRVVYTSMVFSVIVGIIIGIFGFFMSKIFLGWMKTPDEVIDLSATYLKIYFLGLPFSMIYNFGSSLLRACGDAKKPFIYLTVAGLANVGLNFLLVIAFNLDVAGVAIGTVASQAISAILIIISLFRSNGFFHFKLREIRVYKKEAIEIIQIGLPAGLQGVIFSFSNVLIQSSINSLGTYTMDGSGASSSLEGFIYTCMNQTAQAGIAFISANYGANKMKNVKKCIIYTLIIVCIMWAISTGIILSLNKVLLKLYIDNPEALVPAQRRLFVIGLTYFLCGIMDTLAFSLRGIGYSLVPMIVSIIGACGFRIFWIYVIFPINYFHNIEWLAASYPISWILTLSVHLTLLIILYKKTANRLQKKEYETNI